MKNINRYWIIILFALFVAIISISVIFYGKANSTIKSVPVTTESTTAPIIKTTDDQIPPYLGGATGYAISYPQCNGNYPLPPYDFGILGVTMGHSLSPNPCLKSELEWANRAKYKPSFYINLDFPSNLSESLTQSFGCELNDQKCLARHYGYHIAKYAHSYAVSEGATLGSWWLDVQIISKWSGDKTVNAQVVLGAIDYFKEQHLPVGLSTTPYQWNKVVGNLETNLPNWIPGRTNKEVASKYCLDGKNYSNGYVEQLAYIENGFEAVYACGK